ncbi:glycosyltransferase [uncultured Brachyspira sp.]|uniref:glycosyltransferase n=1 Tax=uncultured Brachyspira sp. TaxID=221953 RepID=UPI0026176212|nr:glycosyltransferase [uncultured Brachyspira sp.]
MPKVSVIVPVYNREKLISKCLDNLIKQTFKDIEIIVVNDASTDNSKFVIEEYLKKDDRIILLDLKNNCGSYDARIFGWMKAKGDFIVNCDSDDYYSNDAIEIMYNEAVKNDADVVVAKLMIVSNGKIKEDTWYNKPNTGILIGEDIFKLLLKNRYNWSIHTKLIKKEIIDLAMNDLPKNKRLLFSEDILMSGIIYYYSKKLIYSSNAKYFYEINTSGNFHEAQDMNKEVKRVEYTISILYSLLNFMISKKLDNNYYSSFYVLTNFLYGELLFNNSILNYDLKESLTIFWIEKLGVLSISKDYYSKDLYKMNLSSIHFSNKKEIKKIKNIGIIYNRLYNGGVERFISRLSFILNDSGYNIIIFTNEEPNDKDYSLPNNTARIVLSNDYESRYSIFKESIEKYNIDIFIHNGWTSDKFFIDSLIIKDIGIKLITVLHSVFSYSVYDGRNINNQLNRINMYKFSDALIVLSNTTKRFYEYMGLNNIYYIPNFLTFNINNTNISDLKQKNIVWIGRFEIDVKQPILALEAFSKVVKSIPDAKLLIIGSGDSYEEGLVKQKIKELKIENNCKLLGYQTNIEKYFLESSVHLFTSSFEGFPMVLGEVKSYGIPTVMFDLPYLEMVKDNKGLVRVPQNNINELSNALIKVLEDDEYRNKLGIEAKNSLDNFSDENIFALWKKLFDDIEQSKNNENISIDDSVKSVIDELIHAVQFEENNLRKEHKDYEYFIDKLLPYFFAIVRYHNYFIIKILFIRISSKINKYYEKPNIISLNSLLKNLFDISSDKKYIYIKILFALITIKK